MASDCEIRLDNKTGFCGAPDVGAFYFEDAVSIIKRLGFRIGRVDFTLPPRQSDEACALSKIFTEPGINKMSPPDEHGIPLRKFRIVRCSAGGSDNEGNPVCDLLLTTVTPYANRYNEPD